MQTRRGFLVAGLAAGAVGVTGLGTALGRLMTPPERRPSPVEAMSYPAFAAHRGGAAVAPENTLAAFAGTHGVDPGATSYPQMVAEFDVRALADGTLVLAHDATVDRVGVNPDGSDATGEVTSMTVAQWEELRIRWPEGTSGEPVPATFWDEMVTAYQGTDTVLMPEVKQDTTGLIQSVIDNGMQGQVIAQSFRLAVAQRAATAGVHALHLTNNPQFGVLRGSGIGHVGVSRTQVTAAMCRDARAAGIRVWVYTVNSAAERDRVLGLGADGVMSDYPALLV